MSDLEQQVTAGQQAERLLQDPIFREALIKVEKKYIDQWRASKLEDNLQREKAYCLLRALSDVFKEIQMVIDGGAVAQVTMERSRRKG